jgi:glycosyltransferase involved in cell wall biosynthesis
VVDRAISPGGPLRVLHLYAGNLYGGIETLLVTLARFRDLGAPMVPEFGLCFRGRLWDELRSTGATVHDLGEVRFSRPWTVWRARKRLRRLLACEPFEVVVCHACWPHALFAPVVRRCGVPLVFWAHDAGTGKHWVERCASRTPPDLILANSRFTASTLRILFPRAQPAVLYYPVPSASLDRETVRATTRKALATTDDAVVIITACRLERWKGQDLLLNALGRLRDLPGWECWIAGGAQRPAEMVYEAELRALAGALGIDNRIRFLGQRADVPALLAAADIHCQPNTGPEPFGIAFVEALYAGLPVVTTAIGGAVEVVDASCGRLVQPADVCALGDTLRELVRSENLRSELGAAGPQRAGQLCSPAMRVSELMSSLRMPEQTLVSS